MKRLRLKKLRRRFGITAPRVAVHSHVPWYWRWLTSTVFLVVTITAAWIAYDIGRRYAGFDSSEAEGLQSRLQEINEQLRLENGQLRNDIAAMERQLEFRDLCGIFVRAGFELCRDDPSFRKLLGLLGQRLLTSGESLLSIEPLTSSQLELYDLILSKYSVLAKMDKTLLRLRMENANALGLQALARRARAGDSFRGKRAELFFNNLVDQLSAMMLAPSSPATLALL